MVISMPNHSKICRRLAAFAMVTLSSAWAVIACGAVPWHPDLAAACRAAEVSRRPVLAIFTASWSSASTTLDRTTLASDEAVALITSCFEPACVDVDTTPEVTRRLGVAKVPTACILAADGELLSSFELPETPAGFVAAAARGLQEATVVLASRRLPQGTINESAAGIRDMTEVSVHAAGGLPAFGNESSRALRATTGTEVHGTVPSGGKAIKTIAAKVRRLSDFASDDGTAFTGAESAIATSFRDSSPPSLDSRPALADEASPLTPPNGPQAVPVTVTSRPPQVVADATHPDAKPGDAASAPNALSVGVASTGDATQRPLSIEPSPVPTPNQTARSVPWLGITPHNQPTVQPSPTAQPSPATAAESTAVVPQPQPRPFAGESAAPPYPPQPHPTQHAMTPRGQVDERISTGAESSSSKSPANTAAAATLAGTKPEAKNDTKPDKASVTSSFLSALQKPFNMFSRTEARQNSAQSGTNPAGGQAAKPGAEPAPTAATAAVPTEPDPYGSMPLGLEGYCPVTLAERGVWVEGRAQWGARHRGRTYLFATSEQQKAFLADPDRYAPALSGDDPVIAFDAGKSTPGQRRYGVTYQSRTYLFSSTETRDAFAANPQRYTSGTMVAENRGPATSPIVR